MEEKIMNEEEVIFTINVDKKELKKRSVIKV